MNGRALVDQLLCEVMDLRNDAIAIFYGNPVPFTSLSTPQTDAAAYLEEVVTPHYIKLEGWCVFTPNFRHGFSSHFEHACTTVQTQLSTFRWVS